MGQKKPSLFVLSPFDTHRDHAGYSLLYDLELQLRGIGAQFIKCAYSAPESNRGLFNRGGRESFIADMTGLDIPRGAKLLVLCFTPRFLSVLRSLKKHISRFDAVCLYCLDGFDSKTMNGYGIEALSNIDIIYTAIEEMVPDFKRLGVGDSHYLPFGIDALNQAPIQVKRTVDVFSFGRSRKRYHQALEAHMNEPSDSRLYIHSTFTGAELTRQEEHRRLHWKLLQRSKISLCFESSDVERFCGRSPVLYRWYECLAAGCTIVGTRPKCASADDILAWPNSTIEVPPDADAFLDLIDNLLTNDEMLAEISATNKLEVLKRHDWRYRIRDILRKIDLPMPDNLQRDLDRLSVYSEGVLPLHLRRGNG